MSRLILPNRGRVPWTSPLSCPPDKFIGITRPWSYTPNLCRTPIIVSVYSNTRLIPQRPPAKMAKPILPTMALLALSAFGFYSILGLTERNGWGDAIRASVEEGILPNGEPLRTHYTGVAGLDSFLTILVRFFYSCAAGERPGLSLFTVYFAAQVVPAHAILVLEGLRAGNKSTALSL